MLKWTEGPPIPPNWPGTLPSGEHYRTASCCIIDGVQYSGESEEFVWKSGWGFGHDIYIATYYLTHTGQKGSKKCKPCGAVRIFK